MGINATAVPIKTIEIVTIIGVTLFFENVLIIKHKQVTVSIRIFDNQKLRKNLQTVSVASRTSRPSWNTTRSPSPIISLLIIRVYITK